jgi:hypothetical protein
VLQSFFLFVLCLETGLILFFLSINFVPEAFRLELLNLFHLENFVFWEPQPNKMVEDQGHVLEQIRESIYLILKQNKIKGDIETQNLKIINENIKDQGRLYLENNKVLLSNISQLIKSTNYPEGVLNEIQTLVDIQKQIKEESVQLKESFLDLKEEKKEIEQLLKEIKKIMEENSSLDKDKIFETQTHTIKEKKKFWYDWR